jgi:hypothetical protein
LLHLLLSIAFRTSLYFSSHRSSLFLPLSIASRLSHLFLTSALLVSLTSFTCFSHLFQSLLTSLLVVSRISFTCFSQVFMLLLLHLSVAYLSSFGYSFHLFLLFLAPFSIASCFVLTDSRIFLSCYTHLLVYLLHFSLLLLAFLLRASCTSFTCVVQLNLLL